MMSSLTSLIKPRFDKYNATTFGSVGFLVDLELSASKGYHVGMIYNRRVQYGRTTYTFRHP